MKIILFIILLLTSVFLYSSEVNKSSDTQSSSSTGGENTIKIPLIYISNFQGRFININDTGEEYYNLLGKIKYYQNILPILNKWEKPITLNNGSSFWPSISIKYLLKQKKGIKLVYDLLNENHFDVINIGKKDLYAPYSLMNNLSKDKDILKLPFLSSNMSCKKDSKAPVCKLTRNRKYKILDISGVKVGIISVISQEVMDKTFYKSIDGVEVRKEAEVSNHLAKFLKEKKAVDIVVLMAQIDSLDTSPQKTMVFAQKLNNIDILISNSENTKIIRKYNHNIHIVGANPNRYIPNLLVLELNKVKGKYSLSKVDTYNKKYKYQSSIPKSFKNILDNYKKKYLKEHDISINNMKIENLSFEKFYSFILRLIIDKTDAEISLINKKNFNNSLFPINKLTYNIIEKSLVYNNKVVSFEMKGELLKKFLSKNKGKLLFSNVKFSKAIKVNGRSIIDKKYYKIATTDFLVNGGDGFFKDEFFIKDKEYHGYIKKIFIDYLKIEKFNEKNSVFDSNLEFEDLSKQFLWGFYSSLGLYYMKNDVSNDSAYDKARFASTPSELLKIDGILSLSASSNYHIIENRFELHYYQSKEDNNSFKESDDIALYSFNYKNNYFKLVNGDSPFIPLPYIESKLNTELTKPEEEDKHYFELFVSAGASFLSLKDKLELKLGLQTLKNFRNDEGFQHGMVLGYKLENYELKTLDIPINISSKLEYFKAFDNFNTVDFSLVVNIPILGFFHFSTKLDNYLHKENSKDWSYYYNIFLGVNIIYNNWF